MKMSLAFAICFLLITGSAATARVDDERIFADYGGIRVLGDAPSSLNLGLGAFDVFDDSTAAGQIEGRFGDKVGFVGPLAGLLVHSDGGILGYVGLYADFSLGKILISPHTGFGAYERGEGQDLGGVFEFYSSLTAAYRLEDRSQVGIRFGHISNADLHDRNPGTDLLLLHYSILF